MIAGDKKFMVNYRGKQKNIVYLPVMEYYTTQKTDKQNFIRIEVLDTVIG